MWCRWIIVAALLLSVGPAASVERQSAPAAPAAAKTQTIPRTIIALYDGALTLSLAYSMAEMPLNHLGLKVEYHAVTKPLPDLATRPDVRGILTWLGKPTMENAESVYGWVAGASRKGLPVAILGSLPAPENASGEASQSLVNEVLGAAGIRYIGNYRPYAYDMRIVSRDMSMVEFERAYPKALSAVDTYVPATANAKSHLIVQRGDDASTQSHLVVTTPKGGFIASDYAHYQDPSDQLKAWYVNPFAFFAVVFRTDGMPMPDTTTISGRRIYYSHIDGDGWNSITEVDSYAGRPVTAAEVILRDIAERHPEWPITVAPIAADLDPAWTGDARAQEIARAFFVLDHIEIGTHTYTHPFKWAFFAPGAKTESEFPFVRYYRRVTMTAEIQARYDAWKRASRPEFRFPLIDDIPRAYGDFPFSLFREVEGSIAYINAFAPPGKKVEVLQWSGDALPFEAALAQVERVGIPNINGWGSRFDGDLPSNGNVAPVGHRVGNQLQIFPSHANENVYTALWKGRFFGFRYLITSLKNTETPRRIKPVNLYYHMYSGEKQAALKALREVISYLGTQSLTPVTTSHFARIAQGFFSTELEPLGPMSWRIKNRGALQTLRFDTARNRHVDFTRSSGVLGQNHNGDTLYVALDPADAEPVLTLTNASEPKTESPYLVHSRWLLSGLTRQNQGVNFDAAGFGPGEMIIALPRSTRGAKWIIAWSNAQGRKGSLNAQADKDGNLAFALPGIGPERLSVRVYPAEQRADHDFRTQEPKP